MITVGRVKHDRIPEYFLARYDLEIAAWAQNFAKIGPVKSFILREGYFADLSPNEEQGAQLIQVKLFCRMSRKGVEIAPYTQRDEELIVKHCAKMERLRVPARAILKEPDRPWLPFMPSIERH